MFAEFAVYLTSVMLYAEDRREAKLGTAAHHPSGLPEAARYADASLPEARSVDLQTEIAAGRGGRKRPLRSYALMACVAAELAAIVVDMEALVLRLGLTGVFLCRIIFGQRRPSLPSLPLLALTLPTS